MPEDFLGRERRKMDKFRILCGRPLGHELCRYDYETLHFGFGLVFDRELDRRVLCSTDFLTTIAGKYRENVHVRCDCKQAEDFLELGIQVIIGINSIVDGEPFIFGVNNSQILIELNDPGHLDIAKQLKPAAIILGGANSKGKIGPLTNFALIKVAISKCNIPLIVRGGGNTQMLACAYVAGCAGVFLDFLPAAFDWLRPN